MDQNEKDSYYLAIAREISKGSTCYYGNVGCVIVDKENNIISASCLSDKNDILNCRKQDYCSFAVREGTSSFGTPEYCDYMFPEVNAILAAERLRLQGASLYIWAEDLDGNVISVNLKKTLSKIIRSAGIKRIILPKES